MWTKKDSDLLIARIGKAIATLQEHSTSSQAGKRLTGFFEKLNDTVKGLLSKIQELATIVVKDAVTHSEGAEEATADYITLAQDLSGRYPAAKLSACVATVSVCVVGAEIQGYVKQMELWQKAMALTARIAVNCVGFSVVRASQRNIDLRITDYELNSESKMSVASVVSPLSVWLAS